MSYPMEYKEVQPRVPMSIIMTYSGRTWQHIQQCTKGYTYTCKEHPKLQEEVWKPRVNIIITLINYKSYILKTLNQLL